MVCGWAYTTSYCMKVRIVSPPPSSARMYSTSQKKRTVITVRVLVFTERTVLVVVVQDKHETLLVLTAVAMSSHTSTYAF